MKLYFSKIDIKKKYVVENGVWIVTDPANGTIWFSDMKRILISNYAINVNFEFKFWQWIFWNSSI